MHALLFTSVCIFTTTYICMLDFHCLCHVWLDTLVLCIFFQLYTKIMVVGSEPNMWTKVYRLTSYISFKPIKCKVHILLPSKNVSSFWLQLDRNMYSQCSESEQIFLFSDCRWKETFFKYIWIEKCLLIRMIKKSFLYLQNWLSN